MSLAVKAGCPLDLLDFLLVLGILQVRHGKEVGVVIPGAIRLQELHREDVVESGIFLWQG